MNTRLSRIASAFALAAASAALAACTSVTGGNPSVEDINARYTGPTVDTDVDIPSVSFFAPGSDIVVGVGDNAVACTAGWFIQQDSDTPGFFISGHCARSGVDAPVKINLDGKMTTIGRVLTTTFSEPYNHDNEDVALVGFDFEGKIPMSSFGVPSISTAAQAVGGKRLGDPDDFADKYSGRQVCWMTDLVKPSTDGYTEKCGTIVNGMVSPGNGGKITVKLMAESDDYTPSDAGSPVWTNSGDNVMVPVGIITDKYKDHIIVDTFGAKLDQAGMSVSTKVGRG